MQMEYSTGDQTVLVFCSLHLGCHDRLGLLADTHGGHSICNHSHKRYIVSAQSATQVVSTFRFFIATTDQLNLHVLRYHAVVGYMKAMQPYRHVAHSSELQFQGLTSSFDELFIASRNASCAFGGVIYSNWNGGLKIQGWTLSNTCRLFDTASHVEVSRSRLQTFGGAMDDVLEFQKEAFQVTASFSCHKERWELLDAQKAEKTRSLRSLEGTKSLLCSLQRTSVLSLGQVVSVLIEGFLLSSRMLNMRRQHHF